MITMIPFKVDETGVYFTVLVFEDYVIKIPKKDKVKDVKELKFISDTQTEVSKHVDGILPCWLIENVLIMPKSPGKRTDEFSAGEKQKFKQIKNQILEQIKTLGYDLRDTGMKNMFYDKDQDQLYIIDFHAVRLNNTQKEQRRQNKKVVGR